MIFKREFKRDCITLFDALEKREKFAFTRYGTGECALLRGNPAFGKASHWKANPEKNASYYAAMKAAWECERPDWYVGISCPCCNPVQFRWYSEHLHIPKERLTFAQLFMGSNWPPVRRWLLKHRKDYVLVGPHKCDFEVPADVFTGNWDWTQLRHTLQEINAGTPILFAAGPVGKVLCHELLPTATGPLVDIGSALDIDLWGHPTRAYLRRPTGKPLRKKKERQANDVGKRLWMRTCKWKLAKKAVHK